MKIQQSQFMQTWIGTFAPGLFTTVMGLAGLGIAWRVAHQTVGVPSIIGETIVAVSIVLFSVLVLLYTLKFIFFYQDAQNDFRQSTRLIFLPALPTAGLLISIGIRPYDFDIATYLWMASAPLGLLFAVILVGRWLFENQEFSTMNPTWFFPIVGNAVVPIAGVPLGFIELSWPFFSVGLVFWAVIFIILFRRLVFETDLPAKVSPTVAIMIAPPATIFIAYFALTDGVVDLMSRAMIYTALFLFVLMLPYAKKLISAPASLALWSLTFPLDALTIASFKFSTSTQLPAFEIVAQVILGITTLSVSLVLLRSLVLLSKRFQQGLNEKTA